MKQFENKKDLKNAILKSWDEIEVPGLQKLILTIKNKVHQVIIVIEKRTNFNYYVYIDSIGFISKKLS